MLMWLKHVLGDLKTFPDTNTSSSLTLVKASANTEKIRMTLDMKHLFPKHNKTFLISHGRNKNVRFNVRCHIRKIGVQLCEAVQSYISKNNVSAMRNAIKTKLKIKLEKMFGNCINTG